MNSHSCDSALVPAKIAEPKLRAGFTDVLSTGIVTRWMSANVSPAAIPPNPTGNRALVVDSTTYTRSAVNTTSTNIAATIP